MDHPFLAISDWDFFRYNFLVIHVDQYKPVDRDSVLFE